MEVWNIHGRASDGNQVKSSAAVYYEISRPVIYIRNKINSSY